MKQTQLAFHEGENEKDGNYCVHCVYNETEDNVAICMTAHKCIGGYWEKPSLRQKIIERLQAALRLGRRKGYGK